MKGAKLWLILTAVAVALILVGCGPLTLTISSITQNIVEVTANATDTNLEALAEWCDSKSNILMLWYDFDNQPNGFNYRNGIFQIAAADKNVYLNNEYVGNYGTTSLSTIESTINSSATTFNGTLIMYLKSNDLLGTSWDLIIGEGNETKVANTNYVLAEFEKIDSKVYKVTLVQAGGDWRTFTVPKDISITNKGFAFFRIDDDKVVDARVIYPGQ